MPSGPETEKMKQFPVSVNFQLQVEVIKLLLAKLVKKHQPPMEPISKVIIVFHFNTIHILFSHSACQKRCMRCVFVHTILKFRYSWTKNYRSHRRSTYCFSCATAVGRCNCLIFQSLGKDKNA